MPTLLLYSYLCQSSESPDPPSSFLFLFQKDNFKNRKKNKLNFKWPHLKTLAWLGPIFDFSNNETQILSTQNLRKKGENYLFLVCGSSPSWNAYLIIIKTFFLLIKVAPSILQFSFECGQRTKLKLFSRKKRS